MDRNTLKRIAREWCKSILLANDVTAFEDGLLNIEDISFVLDECRKIAERITKEHALGSLTEIIEKYYENDSQ